MERAFSFRAHVRERILPSLAELDGLSDRGAEIDGLFSTLTESDLDFDLRHGPPLASNLCSDNAALELGYTYAEGEQCGVRYQLEPLAPRRMLKNRYTAFRDRMARAAQSLEGLYPGVEYRGDVIRSLYGSLIAPTLVATRQDVTGTICAVHHYRHRAPRLKAYFGLDYEGEREKSSALLREGLGIVDDALVAPLESFRSTLSADHLVRMLGVDLEPDGTVKAKVYFAPGDLDEAGFSQVVAQAGGGPEAERMARLLRETMFEGEAHTPAWFNLVCLGLSSSGAQTLKLYLRPCEFMDDGVALARLERWFDALGLAKERDAVFAAMGAVGPLDAVASTRGFLNYVSVDVAAEGLKKTSVYYAPQILLTALALERPETLSELLEG